MTLQLPDISKTLPCLACGASTSQKLIPTLEGCSWRCAACSRERPAFTHSQMREIVARGVFGIPPNPTPIDVPLNLQVFLETRLDPNAEPGPDGSRVGEKEAGRQAVLDHVSVTGALPVVGKPLFTKHKFGVVPYGKVVRVVHDTGATIEP